MKIRVKSTPENWAKESSGLKPNTLRILDGQDEITVVNTETGEEFTRKISDITVWKGNIIIISWIHDSQNEAPKKKLYIPTPKHLQEQARRAKMEGK